VISRTDVRSVNCPACQARAGTPCKTRKTMDRVSCHAERWEVYRATLPVLLPAHLRPVIYKHRHGWGCTTSRDWRRCRTTCTSDTPMAAYLRWFAGRNMAARRQILAAHPHIAQHLDESLRHYLQVMR
jgi:hypothetical protein